MIVPRHKKQTLTIITRFLFMRVMKIRKLLSIETITTFTKGIFYHDLTMCVLFEANVQRKQTISVADIRENVNKQKMSVTMSRAQKFSTNPKCKRNGKHKSTTQHTLEACELRPQPTRKSRPRIVYCQNKTVRFQNKSCQNAISSWVVD